jgi:hypothetical protein
VTSAVIAQLTWVALAAVLPPVLVEILKADPDRPVRTVPTAAAT